MKVRIETDFVFKVSSIQYTDSGELCIRLASPNKSDNTTYRYNANIDDIVEERQSVSLHYYLLKFAERPDIKPGTRSSYELAARHVVKYGDCMLDKITTEYLQNFIEFLRQNGLKSNTVRLNFQKVACVLNDAYTHELFDIRILKRVKYPKRDRDKRTFLTESEVKRFAKVAVPEKQDNVKQMFLFSCLTGIRFGDLQNLRWKDVKNSGRHLRLEFHQGKTDTYETLPLCDAAEKILRSIGRNGKSVFKNVSNPWANNLVRRWCKNAGIKKPVNFHSGRHTFCVLLLTKGVPIYTVQRLMCHSDIGTTKIYADIVGRTKSKAVSKLPDINSFGAA